jgi:hypothetical protein
MGEGVVLAESLPASVRRPSAVKGLEAKVLGDLCSWQVCSPRKYSPGGEELDIRNASFVC